MLDAGVSEALVDRITRWPERFTALTVEAGVASATYVPEGTPPAADAIQLGRLADELDAVLDELAPAAGPYR